MSENLKLGHIITLSGAKPADASASLWKSLARGTTPKSNASTNRWLLGAALMPGGPVGFPQSHARQYVCAEYIKSNLSRCHTTPLPNIGIAQ